MIHFNLNTRKPSYIFPSKFSLLSFLCFLSFCSSYKKCNYFLPQVFYYIGTSCLFSNFGEYFFNIISYILLHFALKLAIIFLLQRSFYCFFIVLLLHPVLFFFLMDAIYPEVYLRILKEYIFLLFSVIFFPLIDLFFLKGLFFYCFTHSFPHKHLLSVA